jgi:hypothetical protein
VAQTTRRVEQSRGGTTGSGNNEEVGDESTNGDKTAGDEPRVPHTVGEEGAGEFAKRGGTVGRRRFHGWYELSCNHVERLRQGEQVESS